MNLNATIVASYAIGNAEGDNWRNKVGGLVGLNLNATIVASYATGAVNGGTGADDKVNALVAKHREGAITVSYGFGSTSNGAKSFKFDTEHPTGLTGVGAARANGLTAPGGGANTDVAAEWDQTASKTKGAWDFGTNSQRPALKYADYDGTGGTDYCALFPEKIPGTDTDLECGTSLLPGQGR